MNIPTNPSASFRKRNPELYGGAGSPAAEVFTEKCMGTRIRQSTKPLLNKLETEFFDRLKRHFNVSIIGCQSTRFKLANGIWYKPDFVVWTVTPLAYEVKGPHAFRGGFENLKVAASVCPYIVWHLVWKEGGEWKEQEVLP